MLRWITRLVLLFAPGWIAPGEAAARVATHVGPSDASAQKLASWGSDPEVAVLRQAAALQAAEMQQGSASHSYDFASGCLLAAETVINPSAVRFSQNSIGATFKNGQSIDDVARALRGPGGDQLAAQFPPIRLVERNGQLFTLDNRRLAAFSAADRPIPYRMATPAEAAKDSFKFTTTAEQGWGQFIEVRPPR